MYIGETYAGVGAGGFVNPFMKKPGHCRRDGRESRYVRQHRSDCNERLEETGVRGTRIDSLDTFPRNHKKRPSRANNRNHVGNFG